MAHALNFRLRGSAIRQASADGTLVFTEEFGTGNAPTGNFSLGNGTGSGNASTTYKLAFSVAAGATQFVDLRNGTGSPKDVLNNALSLTTIRSIFIEIDTPGAGNSIVFGPSGNASCANAPFGNNAMNMTINDHWLWTSTIGANITSGAGNIALRNPGAATIAGELRISGE